MIILLLRCLFQFKHCSIKSDPFETEPKKREFYFNSSIVRLKEFPGYIIIWGSIISIQALFD